MRLLNTVRSAKRIFFWTDDVAASFIRIPAPLLASLRVTRVTLSLMHNMFLQLCATFSVRDNLDRRLENVLLRRTQREEAISTCQAPTWTMALQTQQKLRKQTWEWTRRNAVSEVSPPTVRFEPALLHDCFNSPQVHLCPSSLCWSLSKKVLPIGRSRRHI